MNFLVRKNHRYINYVMVSQSFYFKIFKPNIKCKFIFILLETLNCHKNNQVINESKENLKIHEFENVKLKNGNLCIITYFKDFKDIYICKAGKDLNDCSYTNYDINSMLKDIHHSTGL